MRAGKTLMPYPASKIGSRTKGDLFATRKNWQSARTAIQRNAVQNWRRAGKEFMCRCGYNKHAEIAHIIPVSHFPSEATIAQINALDNLVALCPNCHWEFDNLPPSGAAR
jgi:5-methylcytosine-specific restriction endonuclease McrA